jgi:hypothetical protein
MGKARWVLLMGVGATACAPLPAEDVTGAPLHDADRVAIGQIQGRDQTSPMLGQQVLIEGLVVRSLRGDYDYLDRQMAQADRAAGQLQSPAGWFVQDGGDGDADTSDGVLVLPATEGLEIRLPTTFEHTNRLANTVRSGDRIKVRGQVVEVDQARAAEQLRSSGASVGRGKVGGTLTAIVADRIIVQDPAAPLMPLHTTAAAPGIAMDEASEGMRQSPMPQATAR